MGPLEKSSRIGQRKGSGQRRADEGGDGASAFHNKMTSVHMRRCSADMYITVITAAVDASFQAVVFVLLDTLDAAIF